MFSICPKQNLRIIPQFRRLRREKFYEFDRKANSSLLQLWYNRKHKRCILKEFLEAFDQAQES